MELYSPAGQLVFEGPFDTRLDLRSYPAGTYQLVFRGDEFVVRRSVGIIHERSRLSACIKELKKGLRNAQPLFFYTVIFLLLAVECIFECIDKVEFFPSKQFDI